MSKLTETQTIILSRAATRPDNLAMPLPKGLAGAAAKMTVTKMIARGWLEEVDANLRRGEPLWRETGDGHGTTLIATEAGFAAIGIEPVVANAMTNLRKVKLDRGTAPKDAAAGASINLATPRPVVFRTGTKQTRIITLLQRPEGAAIAEIAAETGWQVHSIRGFISGGLKKKLALQVTSERDAIRGRVYRLTATA